MRNFLNKGLNSLHVIVGTLLLSSSYGREDIQAGKPRFAQLQIFEWY
jgi:hypothetical protein